MRKEKISTFTSEKKISILLIPDFTRSAWETAKPWGIVTVG